MTSLTSIGFIMGKLKNAMFDVGYYAMEHGIEATTEQFNLAETDVQTCILFVESFTGTWEEYLQALKPPVLH